MKINIEKNKFNYFNIFKYSYELNFPYWLNKTKHHQENFRNIFLSHLPVFLIKL